MDNKVSCKMHRSPIDSRHLSPPPSLFLFGKVYFPRFANDCLVAREESRKDSSRLLKPRNLNPSRLVTRDLYISEHLFSLKSATILPSPSDTKAFRAASWLCSFSLLPTFRRIYTPCAEAVTNQSRSRIIVPKRGSTLLSAPRGDGKLEVTWCDRGD